MKQLSYNSIVSGSTIYNSRRGRPEARLTTAAKISIISENPRSSRIVLTIHPHKIPQMTKRTQSQMGGLLVLITVDYRHINW